MRTTPSTTRARRRTTSSATATGAPFHGYVWPDKAVFPDFLRPDVRAWWGDWQRALTEVGVAGIWNDMNEPALDDRPFGDNGPKIAFPLDSPAGPAGRGRHARRDAQPLRPEHGARQPGGVGRALRPNRGPTC